MTPIFVGECTLRQHYVRTAHKEKDLEHHWYRRKQENPVEMVNKSSKVFQQWWTLSNIPPSRVLKSESEVKIY